MSAKRRAIQYVVAVGALALPVILLPSSLKSPARLNAFDRAVLSVAAPLQRAVSWVVDGVGDAWHHYVWLVDVQKENDELRRDNERLRQALANATRKANEAEGLEALV